MSAFCYSSVAAQLDTKNRPSWVWNAHPNWTGSNWHHVMHRSNIRERSGSATGLNAGSHPAGTIVGALVVLELSAGRAGLDAGGSRSPLCTLSTDVVANFAPVARPDVAMQATPANTAASMTAPANCLELFLKRWDMTSLGL